MKGSFQMIGSCEKFSTWTCIGAAIGLIQRNRFECIVSFVSWGEGLTLEQ